MKLSSSLKILLPKPRLSVSLSSWVKKEPWKKVISLSVSFNGLKVFIPISGLLPSFDLSEISVSWNFPSKKFSSELKKLLFNWEVSATDAAEKDITANKVIKYFFHISKTIIYFKKINIYFFGLKTKQTPLLQYLFPVGSGPSSKMWPWWPPHFLQWYSVLA